MKYKKIINENKKSLKVVFWLTGIYFIMELILGLYSKSISVLSDAFHTFSAVGGILIALIASKISLKPANKKMSFGSYRAEIIGALLNGLFLFLMALFIFYVGIKRLRNPIELPLKFMLIAAFGGLITEIVSIKLLFYKQRGNLNMKGAFWHVMQTFVGSIIILIAAIVIWLTGYFAIDAILGMIFGLVLFYASWRIIRESFNIFLESVPKEINLDLIKEEIMKIKEVQEIRHIHSWALTSGKNLFSAHIKIKDISKSQMILKKIKEILKNKFNIYFSTIQIETKDFLLDDAKDIDILRREDEKD